MAHIQEKNEPDFGKSGNLKAEDNGNVDIEGRRSSTTVQGRRMSRIGPPPRNASITMAAEEGATTEEHSKLVEMEANDAIKYRTCSWQKVGLAVISTITTRCYTPKATSNR